MASSEKKRVVEIADASKQNQLTLRCGDCLHHKGSPHPAFGKPCSELGVKGYATAPTCYSPDVSIFRKSGPTVFAQLASILSTFTPQQCRILMGLLRSAGSLEKYGHSFLDRVYFRSGEDYLDNYYSGFILGVGYGGTLSLVGSSFFTAVRSPIIAHMLPESVFSAEIFQKRKKKLVKEGKLYAPRKAHKNVIEGVDYEPPTLETPQEHLEMSAKSLFKKKQKDGKVAKKPSGGVLEVSLTKAEPEVDVDDDELED